MLSKFKIKTGNSIQWSIIMNKKGVTLIELVVVFIIIAIMAGLLAPNIGAWLPSYRLRSATRDIASTFRAAQMRAISEQVSYTVSFNSADTGKTSNTAYIYAGTVTTLPSGITIVSNTLTNLRAVFNSDSTCTSAPGGVILQNTKGTQRRITVLSATGKVTIQ
jgi:prepilin-type N-terminal cleavage/methylation domain-containing protein